MSRKFDQKQYNDEEDYGEKLHRDKKKVKRGKSKYFDEVEYQQPRRPKPLRRYNSSY